MHRLELIAIKLICVFDAGLLALAHVDADKPKFCRSVRKRREGVDSVLVDGLISVLANI